MVRVMLRFTRSNVEEPITSQVILEQGVPVNILSAHMNQLGGEILAEIAPEHAEKVIQAFRDKGVTVDVRKRIEKDPDKCIDCGGCIAICPIDAYSFNEKYDVVLDEEKCLGITCGLCVDTCPQRAIRLIG